MKKLFVFFLLMSITKQLCFSSNLFPIGGTQQVNFTVQILDPTVGTNPYPRSPIQIPTAYVDGYTFNLTSAHPDYVVRLLDENDDTIFVATMFSRTNSIELPSSLSGDYQIQLIWNNWMFYGWITL